MAVTGDVSGGVYSEQSLESHKGITRKIIKINLFKYLIIYQCNTFFNFRYELIGRLIQIFCVQYSI